jgi:sialate O-acetylesterase
MRAGDADRPKWEAVFQPISERGPYQIVVTQVADNCQIVLDDVLCGDVWICSGQSNMQHSVYQVIFNFLKIY